jgi:glucokinase
MSRTRIVADVGGTNARFARVADDGTLVGVAHLPSARFDGIEPALDAYLTSAGINPGEVDAVALAVAGPVDGDTALLTNLPWRIHGGEVSRHLGGARVLLMNDLAAVALLLPRVMPEGDAWIQPAHDGSPASPRLAVNLGTGFGAACCVSDDDRALALATEAGHMSFPALEDPQREQLHWAHRIEDLLSGGGLARLREQIGTAQADTLISAVLGRICGDLVLATGAWGGVYLCGGAMLGLAATLDRPGFLHAFSDKGPMSARMRGVGVALLEVADPALRGLALRLLPGPAADPASG